MAKPNEVIKIIIEPPDSAFHHVENAGIQCEGQ